MLVCVFRGRDRGREGARERARARPEAPVARLRPMGLDALAERSAEQLASITLAALDDSTSATKYTLRLATIEGALN
ncbi:MAG: hypothetical protein NVS3B20_14730 [Polyangiales bacterium]